MKYDYDTVKADLKAVILEYCKNNNIDPTDSMTVIAHAPRIWSALRNSGKMPIVLTYEHMMSGMFEAAMREDSKGQYGHNRY